jgi:transketolase
MVHEPPQNELQMLEERALSVKRRFLAMYKKANAGHIGSSLSCTELLVLCRFAWMSEGDRFVLSKGHAAGALYSVLAEAGRLSEEDIDTFYEEGTFLSALPPFGAIDEIPFATGSLGYGLSICAGMAMGARFKKEHRRFFCVTSDGELNEGSVWEAALFIAHHRLKNVIWMIDRNKLQAIGRTEDVLALEPLNEKLTAFGFHVLPVDGHDFRALLAARDASISFLERNNQPVVLVANTVKGHGISFMEDTVDCHYLPLENAQYAQAVSELARACEASRRGHEDAF